MPLTERERTRLLFLWRNVVNASLRLDETELKSAFGGGLPALGSPFENDRAKSFALFALERLAYAWTRGTSDDRVALAPGLKALAFSCAQVLDRGAPPPPLAPRQLPFRRDVDG